MKLKQKTWRCQRGGDPKKPNCKQLQDIFHQETWRTLLSALSVTLRAVFSLLLLELPTALSWKNRFCLTEGHPNGTTSDQ